MNIIICGILKNSEHKNIQLNMELAIETGKQFNDYKIVLYENNSTDNTKQILQNYASDEHFTIISEDIDDLNLKEKNVIWAYTEITGSDHPCRIEHISNARNKLLQEINKPEYSTFSHVIMIDLDSNGWDINGILDSFSRKEDWDAIFASSPSYYDFYALRCDALPFGPEITGEHFWKDPRNFHIPNNNLIPVYSAFNGIGIYKKHLLEKYNYDFVVNDEVKTFYKKYMNTNNISVVHTEIIKNPCSKFPFGVTDENIFWKSNSGYKGLVICEHVPLNIAIYNNNHKLFINPKMIYHWSS
jgi:hypothetical protein